MKRIAENNHTVEDTLSIGEKITAFRQSEYWIILEECIDSVIKDAVREGKKLNKSSDEILGEQAGALKVKDLIIGLDKSATIMNNQMAAQRKVESEEENGEDIKDHEDITPTASNRVGI
jgi:hypothetical protein